MDMINLNIKKDNEKVMAEYHLKANDRIDNLTLGMLVNNDIKGVASVFPIQIDDDIFFKYDITGMITMREYLGEYVKREHILRAFYSVASAVRESAEYMINWTSFSLDLDEIYVYKETGKAQLLCLPLLTVVNDGNLCNFFKNVLFSQQFDLEESSDYVGRLINFLNVRTYSLDKFIYELEEMLGLEHISEEDDNEYEDNNKSIESKEFVKDFNGKNIESEEVAEDFNDKSIESEEVAEDFNDKNIESEEVTEDFEDDDSDEIEIIYDASDEEITDEPKEIAEEVRMPQPAEEQFPFLVRVSSKEKIMINKEIFYVGSSEAEADYCIEGNPTVSDMHAYIIKHGKEYFVVDNNTKGRTYLNRVEIEEDEDEVFIPHGAHISFGTEEFEFRMHE